jgi:methylated-DNA-protein-cysteine methyltransferase-like protein
MSDPATLNKARPTSQAAVLGFFERVYEVVRMIPRGQVATYGQIAAIVSHRGAARTVGWALHSLVQGTDVPWHRVINARGQISLDPGTRQTLLLREEGVIVNTQGKVDLRKFQWLGLDWPEVEALRHRWHTQETPKAATSRSVRNQRPS